MVRSLKAVRRIGWRVLGRLDRRPLVTPARPDVGDRPIRLLIGPANFAGQAAAWARAVENDLPGVRAVAMAVDRPGLAFAADYLVPERAYRSPRWSAEQQGWLARNLTHVLIDAMRPVTGPLHGDDCAYELPRLLAAGLRVGLVAHGSDVRVPSLHRATNPYSPFDPSLRATTLLEHQARWLASIINGFDGPTFVSTPDLLDYVPGARWLPVVVDPHGWTDPGRPALERQRPVVLHVPSNPWLKGSQLADPVLSRLHDEGVIEYRRLVGVSPEEFRAAVLDADVVLDQLLMGWYGVTAVQAMLAGRLTLAHVGPGVRDRVPGELPVVEVTPDSLGDVVVDVARNPASYAAAAAEGPGYARKVHDGRLSARVLADFLGVPPG